MDFNNPGLVWPNMDPLQAFWPAMDVLRGHVEFALDTLEAFYGVWKIFGCDMSLGSGS